MTENGRLLADGPPARMTAAAIAETRADEVPLLYAFALEAGQIQPTAGEPFPATDMDRQQVVLITNRVDWAAVTLVGEGYVDAQCNRFLTLLDQLERSKRASLSNLTALQSASVGIMGLALAAQKAIGIVGIAFGLAANLIENTTSIVLYQLPAPSIRTIVKAQRDILRQDEGMPNNVLRNINNQGLASARLAEYVQYCVPVTIEGNVGNILANTHSDTNGSLVATATTPTVTSALAPVRSAIPPGTPIVRVQPTEAASGSVLDLPVQQRKVRLVRLIRGISDPLTLQRVANILLPTTSDALGVNELRARVIVEVNSRVSSSDPALAKQQMDRLAQQLAPVLGSTI